MTLAELRTELARLGAARADQRSQLEQAYVELAGTPAGEDADRLIEAIAERRRQTLLLKARAAETVRRELDPRQFAPQLDGSVPILLMPLRIQTRFQNAANGRVLLIRVYPDDVSVERHEPRLSASERAAGEQFWSGDAADQKALWRGIVARFNLRRAAWIVKASAPAMPAGDRLDLPVRVPAAWTLPEQLVFRLYVGEPEHLAGEFLGAPIPDGLEMGIDPTEPSLGFNRAGGNLEYPSELRWQTDVEEAVRVGMGIALPLTQLGIPDAIARVVVVGVRMGTDEFQSAGLLERLIAGHRYTDGFSIVPQGTPTNVTNDADAPPVPDVDGEIDRLMGPGAYKDDGAAVLYEAECDGLRLAHALGIAPEVLRHVEHAGQEDGREAIAMKRALWAGTFGYFAQHMLAPLLDSSVGAPDPNRPERLILAARFFFTHFVFARGPLPAFRVGSQPYGVLPIAADTLSVTDHPLEPWGETFIDTFILNLHGKMAILAKPWLELTRTVRRAGAGPDANARLLDVLATQASSVEWRSEQLVGLEYLAFATDFKNQGAADSAFNPFVEQLAKRWNHVNEFVADLFPLTDQQFGGDNNLLLFIPPRVLQLSFLGGFWKTIVDQLGQQVKRIERSLTTPLTGDTIDNQPYSETRGIDPAYPNYIDWLSRTGFDDVRRGLTRLDDDGKPEPVTALLYMALRHSLLYEHAFLAMRLFRRFRVNPRTGQQYVWSDFAEKDVYNLGFVFEPTYWDYVHRADPAGWPIGAPAKVGNQPVAGSVLGLVEARDTLLAKVPDTKGFLGDVDEVYRALQLFAPETFPTARLERLFAEHIDLAGYRLDAWLTGHVYQRLIAFRVVRKGNQQLHPLQPAANKVPGPRYDLNHRPLAPYATGIYLGAYGWVENLQADKAPDPVDDLPPELQPQNGGAVTRDADNYGFIHAPSLNHAVTAAVLRSASVTQPDTTAFNVDLSSARTRDALWLIDGVRNGQSPAALLGYRFERALRDSPTPDLQQWLPLLRAAFPMPRTGNTDPGAKEAIPAHDVVNGLRLVQAARDNTLAAALAFAGADVPVLLTIAAGIVDTFDACGDLMLAESVHQAVQGNYDRAGSVITASGEFTHVPTEFHVVETPRSGTALSHRLLLAMDAADAGEELPSPRSRLQPELNRWIGSVIGPLNAISSTLTYRFAGADGEPADGRETIAVTYDRLGLEPLDLLFVADDRVASDLDRRLDLIARPLFDAAHPGVQVAEISTDSSGAAAALTLLDSIRALLAAARPATVRDFVAPSTLHGLAEDAIDGIDEEELLLRVLGVTRLDPETRNPSSLWASFEAVLTRAIAAAPDPAAVLIDAAAFGIPEAVPAGPDLQQQLDRVRAILTTRRDAALAKWTPFVPPAKDALRVCREITDILLGGSFPLMPRLTLPAAVSTAMLPAGAPAEDQVGDWLFRLSTVRDGARGLQDLRVRAAELSTELTPIRVVQWPADNKSWIALPVPDGETLTGDLISVAVQAAGSFDLARPVVAVSVDEWSETIPSKDETTGITFHYDAPNAEPPQAVLLAVAHGVTFPLGVQQPPLRWTWDEVVACVDQALLLAKVRCVDPDMIRKTPLDALLPATMAAQTTFPATISTSWFGNMVKEVANIHSDILKRT